jgi:hypothetical protein
MLPFTSPHIAPSLFLAQPPGHGYLLSNCQEKHRSVSFANTSPINLVIPDNLDDSSKTSLEEIDILPHPFSNSVSILVP